MNQQELRRMAEERIRDAEALAAAGRWEFAYYAAGYAVECALKSSALARMVVTGWIFKVEPKKMDECRTHNFSTLIRIAGLEDELNNTLAESAGGGGEFGANWEVVKKWNVTSRYESKSEAETKELLAAIFGQPHGVLAWIRNYW